MKVDDYASTIVNVELSNACNLECVFCDWPRLKKHMLIKSMEVSLLKKIIEEVAPASPYELGIVGLGDPLLNNKFAEHLEIINKYKKSFERISLNTNGIALTIENSEEICRSGINHVTFSLNATNPDMYLKLTKRNKFFEVVNNIRLFVEVVKHLGRTDISVNIQAMAVEKNDIAELEDLFRSERKEGVYLFIRDIYNKPALAQNDTLGAFKFISKQGKRYPCWSIFSRIYIDVEGNFYPCTIGNDCYRENSSLCMGNIKKALVFELFNSPALVEARERSCFGEVPFDECESCNVWNLLPNNFVWNKNKKKWIVNDSALRCKDFVASKTKK